MRTKIISSVSQKYKMRRNLEVNQSKPSVSCSVFVVPFTNKKKALLKPKLNEQNNSNIPTLYRNGVT